MTDTRKPATIKEIARQLNVSVSTVSRALRDHPGIGLRTRQRVQELAAQLNYEPNQAAISFKQGRTRTIGLIVPNLYEEFFCRVIQEVEEQAQQQGYTVLIGQSHDRPAKEREVLESMRRNRVDGILISLAKDTRDYGVFDELKQYGLPVVFFDRVPAGQLYHGVRCNLARASSKLVDLLAQRGHTHIGFINGPITLAAAAEREQGVKAAAARYPGMEIVLTDTGLGAQATRIAMKQLLAREIRPTAVIAFNDYVALEAIVYSREQGLVINKDISFVSYAHLSFMRYLERGLLASVEQFPAEQGRAAMELLLRMVDGGENIDAGYQVLDAKLVVN
ncbi:LacI family DNA-binding transcriptional regulator [Nostoc ellipsosporum NOK]|nr:LacI family DNA-binding transcriptional regulator [Nostoc ellipsosporum NOK]